MRQVASAVLVATLTETVSADHCSPGDSGPMEAVPAPAPLSVAYALTFSGRSRMSGRREFGDAGTHLAVERGVDHRGHVAVAGLVRVLVVGDLEPVGLAERVGAP